MWREWVAWSTLEHYSFLGTVSLLFKVSDGGWHQFAKDASETPDIDALIIVFVNEGDFRWTVPPWYNCFSQVSYSLLLCSDFLRFLKILCHFALEFFLAGDSFSEVVRLVYLLEFVLPILWEFLLLMWWLRYYSGQSKITEFDVTAGVNQHVLWLDISMHHVCWVQEVDGTKHVI